MGSRAGIPNKKKSVHQLFADYGCDPVAEMIQLAMKEFDPDKKFHKMAELAPYGYAKLKAVEVTVNEELARQAEEFSKYSREEKIKALRAKADELERE